LAELGETTHRIHAELKDDPLTDINWDDVKELIERLKIAQPDERKKIIRDHIVVITRIVDALGFVPECISIDNLIDLGAWLAWFTWTQNS